jgi:hypothetical protein
MAAEMKPPQLYGSGAGAGGGAFTGMSVADAICAHATTAMVTKAC